MPPTFQDPKGLRNLGNTCWMNTTAQIYVSIVGNTTFQAVVGQHSDPLLMAMKDLAMQMYNTEVCNV